MSRGDPHLSTAGHQAFDLQALGEFTALRSDSGDLVVQVRQIALGGSRSAAVNGVVAVNINGDRLTASIISTGIEIRVNGSVVDVLDEVDLPKGGRLIREDRGYLMIWADQTALRVEAIQPWGFNVSMQLVPGRLGTVHGLLGPYTDPGQPGVEARDGTVLMDEQLRDRELMQRTFGDGWRISQAESLFDYAPGESTATFDDRTFPDLQPPNITEAQRAAAERVCKRANLAGDALAGCIFDVTLSGDAGFATTTVASLRGQRPAVGVLATIGSSATDAPGVGTTKARTITIGETVTDELTTKGAIGTYTFHADPGQIVFFEPQAGQCLPFEILDPAGVGVTSGGVCLDLGPVTLTAGGDYAIVIHRASTTDGNYRFRLRAG